MLKTMSDSLKRLYDQLMWSIGSGTGGGGGGDIVRIIVEHEDDNDSDIDVDIEEEINQHIDQEEEEGEEGEGDTYLLISQPHQETGSSVTSTLPSFLARVTRPSNYQPLSTVDRDQEDNGFEMNTL